MSFRMLRPLLVCSILCLGHVAMAQTKVAVISLQKAVADTAEMKKAEGDWQASLKPRQDQADKLNKDIAEIGQKLQTDTTLSPQAGLDLQAEYKRKQTELQRMQEDLQADFNEFRQTTLTKLSERMQTVVKKLAEEKGFDLVVDTQVALFFKPAMDITAEATAAYDKTYPAAAAPAAPATKK